MYPVQKGSGSYITRRISTGATRSMHKTNHSNLDGVAGNVVINECAATVPLKKKYCFLSEWLIFFGCIHYTYTAYAFVRIPHSTYRRGDYYIASKNCRASRISNCSQFDVVQLVANARFCMLIINTDRKVMKIHIILWEHSYRNSIRCKKQASSNYGNK